MGNGGSRKLTCCQSRQGPGQRAEGKGQRNRLGLQVGSRAARRKVCVALKCADAGIASGAASFSRAPAWPCLGPLLFLEGGESLKQFRFPGGRSFQAHPLPAHLDTRARADAPKERPRSLPLDLRSGGGDNRVRGTRPPTGAGEMGGWRWGAGEVTESGAGALPVSPLLSFLGLV